MRLVVADLEGTLTEGSTGRGVGRYLARRIGRGRYAWFVATHIPALLLARLGLGSMQAARDRWIADMGRFLRGYAEKDLDALADWVVDEELWPKRRLVVLAEVEEHRRRGHRVVLVSAAYQPVLAAFARRLGAEALGTMLEMEQGRATGALAEGVNSGEQKLARLQEIVNGKEFHVAYGDTQGDLSILEHSQQPTAVYPDTALRGVAERRGWRIIGPEPSDRA